SYPSCLLNLSSLRELSLSNLYATKPIKGGSFLCAENYCSRYRNSSRYPQDFDLAATHVGFRTILRSP
ncbi:SUMF1/EgtB/PvdO family nonheme iron enzyme, partial [Acinetobacter baumannii]|uniref:SUMF1/EgtB/PvdO family nonheme iron enzyme n=3 Tax=Acinetobacter baumannii TaxID=470 RepID=UPI0021C0C4AB